MLATMSREAFQTMGDDELGTACFEPIIRAYKEIQTRGEDFASELYTQLSPGQQALFVFRPFYNHAIKSAPDLY